jgi:tetratricopeptide (TPR) repeat protein
VYQAFASRFLGTIGYQRGPREEAEDLTLQVFDWLERIGDTTMQSEVLQLLAQFALARGDVEGAAARLRDARRLAGDATSTSVEVDRYLAQAYWRLGRERQAKRAAAAARAAAAPDDPQATAMALVAEAFAAAAGGRPDEASAAFEEAIALLDDPADVVDRADVHLAYGRVLTQMGDTAGVEHIRQARKTFEAMGALATVAEIEAELAVLGARSM